MTIHSIAEPTIPGPTVVPRLPLYRLNLMRVGYAVVGFGLVVVKWPLLVTHPDPWPLFEGVVTCILVAMSLLALLGLRYPVRLLPILLFECAWKLIWLSVVAAPKASSWQRGPGHKHGDCQLPGGCRRLCCRSVAIRLAAVRHGEGRQVAMTCVAVESRQDSERSAPWRAASDSIQGWLSARVEGGL